MQLKFRRLNVLSFIILYVLLISFLYALSYKFLISSFEEIEDSQNKNNLTTILNTINNDIQNLKMHTKDYSNWDDTYEFIEDENQEYIYTNFREGSNTLEQVDFDGIIYHNLNHKIIFSKFADEFLNSQKDKFEAFVLSKIEDEQQISTIINYKSSFIYISKSPVLKSDSTGEIKGFVITIRKLKLEKFNNDQAIFKKIEIKDQFVKNYNISIDLQNIKNVKISINKTHDVISNNISFFDKNNNYLISLIVDNQRDIVVNGEKTVYIFNFLISIILFFILYFIYKNQYLIENQNILLNKEIERRTKQLNKAFRKLKDKNNELFTLANIDSLTKIRNRRSYFIESENLLNIAIQKNRNLCILIIDIDYFKSINDKYGHAVGDKVLIEFCNIVSSNIGNDSIFGRIGGEEFCITFVDKTIEEVNEISEDIRIKCEKNIIKIDSQEIKFTVSMGLNCREDFSDIDLILQKADEFLYKAKQSGRNKVIRSGDNRI
mgnify:FL=1